MNEIVWRRYSARGSLLSEYLVFFTHVSWCNNIHHLTRLHFAFQFLTLLHSTLQSFPSGSPCTEISPVKITQAPMEETWSFREVLPHTAGPGSVHLRIRMRNMVRDVLSAPCSSHHRAGSVLVRAVHYFRNSFKWGIS